MRAKDYRRVARENLKGNWLKSATVMLVVLLICGLIGTAYSYISKGIDIYNLVQEFNHESKEGSEPVETTPPETTPGDGEGGEELVVANEVPLIIEIINFIAITFGGYITLGHCKFLLNQYHKRKASFKDIFVNKGLFSSAFLVELILYVVNMVCQFFSVPGIILGYFLKYRYCMAMYILLENPYMRPEKAVKESAKLMKGHKWELFCLDMSFIGWHLLGILTLGVGSLFVTAYSSAAHAAFYRQLCPEEVPEEDEDIEELEECTDVI